MGQTAENLATLRGLDRKELDEFGVRSQNLAEKAIADGFWEREITPVTTPDGTVVSTDDGPRAGVTYEAISQLQPVFRPDGVVTAGNCCALNDGAAAVIVMSDTRAAELGLTPLARIVSTGVSGLSPEIMGLGPVEASKRALAHAGMSIGDIDLVEINEAFAAQVVPSYQDLGIDLDRLNVNGGAIAVGHPFGMTGARLQNTMLNSLDFHDKTHRPDHHVRRRRSGHGADPRADLSLPGSPRTPGPERTRSRCRRLSDRSVGPAGELHTAVGREPLGLLVESLRWPAAAPHGHLEPELLAGGPRPPRADDLVALQHAARPPQDAPQVLARRGVRHDELAVATLEEQVERAEQPHAARTAGGSASASASSARISSRCPSTVHRDGVLRPVRLDLGDGAVDVPGDRASASPGRGSGARRGRRRGCSGTFAAGRRQPLMRCSTGGEVPALQLEPAWSAASRNGCS